MVNGMIECLRWVEEKGESLRVAGEGLMQEEVRGGLFSQGFDLVLTLRPYFQTQLHSQTEQLAARLEYFTFLEQAQRMLNYPGENLVLSEGFLAMVERLDSCLQYLKVNVSLLKYGVLDTCNFLITVCVNSETSKMQMCILFDISSA